MLSTLQIITEPPPNYYSKGKPCDASTLVWVSCVRETHVRAFVSRYKSCPGDICPGKRVEVCLRLGMVTIIHLSAAPNDIDYITYVSEGMCYVDFDVCAM